MLGSGPGYFVLCLEVGQVPFFFLLAYMYVQYIVGQVSSFSFTFFVGQVRVGQVFFFFVAWYEWARYDVGQLTRENV